MSRWDTFNEQTRHNPPRELYQEAIKLVTPGTHCLDIAAGALVDTKDMLSQGFRVTAIDANPSLIDLAQNINSDQLTITVSTMEAYDYGHERFDYMNAMFALPFIAPTNFETTFHKMLEGLKPGGIFAFHLFGPGDDWYGTPNMTFHSADQVHELITGHHVIACRELQDKGLQADGGSKNWHVFQVILQK